MKLTLKKYDRPIAEITLHQDKITNINVIDEGKTESEIRQMISERRYPASRPESKKLRQSGLLNELRQTRLSNSEDGYWLEFPDDNIKNYQRVLYESGTIPESTKTTIAASPIGMQPKRFERGQMYKTDLFPGEAISEVLLSIYLEACEEDKFIKYRFGTNASECVSKSYKPTYSFIPMYDLLVEHIKNEHPILSDKIRTLKKSDDDLVDTWVNKIYYRTPIRQRVDIFLAIAEPYVDTQEYKQYLSKMVTLDTMFGNTDRHLNNFGIMYNHETQKYEVPLLFDNGRALGVGEDMTRISKYGIGNLPAKPFGTTHRNNRKAVEQYNFQFDVEKFLKLYREVVEPYHNGIGPQFRLFQKQLVKYHPTDVHGKNVKNEIDGYRLEQALKNVEEIQKEM